MKVWELRSVNEHRDDSGVQKTYGDHSTGSANARPPYRSHAQTKSFSSLDSESDSDSSDGEDAQVQYKFDWYQPWQSNPEGEYERVITPHFSADGDDIFMRSMIKSYALEEKKCDDDMKNCAPTGHFWMNAVGTRAAAKEVLATHKGLKGEALKTYLDTYFDKAWSHFDVNRAGTVEVIKMPQFMRFLASDQSMSLGQ